MGIGISQRQSIISFLWQIAFTLIGSFGMMYLAHKVGAEILGSYFLFLSYLSIVSLISDGGFGGAAIKRISEGEEPDEFFSAFIAIRLLFMISVVIFLIVFHSYFVDLDRSGLFTWLIMALIVSLFFGSVSHGIAGSGKMGIYYTGTFINNISTISIQVAAVFLGFGIAGLVGGFIAGMLAATIFDIRFLDLRAVRFSWVHLKKLSTFSFWLFLTSSGMLIFSYADTIMIGYYKSNADVGVYRIALQLSTMATFITHAIIPTLWPKVSGWVKSGKSDLIEESLSRGILYSMMLAVPVMAGGILLGDKLMYYFYGAEFVTGYATLLIMLIVQVINVFYYFFTSFLSAQDHQKESFKATSIAAIANILLNFALIPKLGIEGAALATFICMTLNATIAWRLLSKIMIIRIPRDSLLNILIASIIMSIFVGGYRMFMRLDNIWWTLLPIVGGGVIYTILILKFDRKIYEELKGIMAQMSSK